MPDIFISYKKEERDVAGRLATRLTEAGYDVWWDDALLAGERFEDEITNVLDQSAVVVVLWSRQSVQSDWVKAEAETARQQKKALPVIIDDLPASKMPLLYRGMHAARLAGWEGEPEHSGWVELTGSIRDRLGRAKGPRLSESQAEAKLEQNVDLAKSMIENTQSAMAKTPSRPSPLRLIALLLVVLIALGGVGTLVYLQVNRLAPEDAASIERCTNWALGARADSHTTLPPLEETTAADCERASQRFPDNGDYLGLLALVRIQQGNQDAVALANRAVDKGGAWGHYALGLMHHQGINLTADFALAATSFKAAADMGLSRAQGRLCLMAVDGGMILPIPATREEIGVYCSKGAAANDSLALLATGYQYETGIDGRIVNPAAAAEYYDRASRLGDDDATVRLGILYHRGLGVPFDAGRAVALYQQAADNGNPSGLRSLAVSLEVGDAIPQDVNRAAQLFEQASIRWDVPALLLSGYGIGAPAVVTLRDRNDAEMLAGAPTTVTGYRIRGLMSAYGNLRPRDVAVAEQELTSCADLGDAICQAMLGYYYAAGLNGTRDPVKGAALYQSSANSGNLYGQYYLAWATELGDGVQKDPSRAIELYRLAARQGHLTSINRLQQLGQPIS